MMPGGLASPSSTPPEMLLQLVGVLVTSYGLAQDRRASGIYAPRVRADPAATLACGTQRTPLGRTCSQRTASGTFPHWPRAQPPDTRAHASTFL